MTFDNAQNKSKLKETITSENHSLHFDFDDFFFVYLNIMLFSFVDPYIILHIIRL